MKRLGFGLFFLACAVCARGDDLLPKRPPFAVYEAMLNRSPFAVATAVAPPAAPDFARDLYVANAARLQDGDLVTIASTTDRNFKEYLKTGEPNEHGYAITDIKWSDRVGETKVTITKDGKYATLTFNQALISQPVQNPAQPLVNAVPQAPAPFAPVPNVPQVPLPNVGGQNGAPNRVRSRGVIQRNPNPLPPVPTPVPQPEDQDQE